MTQLVQLQTVADRLAAAGFAVFAISNDPREVLSSFADSHDIQYPLLSDEDSAVIASFGIMNQLISPDEGRSMRWHGIPYPGTYYVDADGVVTDKDFHQHHARRASGVSVLARALGETVQADPDAGLTTVTGDESARGEVSITAGLADPALQLELITQLVIDLDIPAGSHLYAPGSPEGFTALSVEVSGSGIRTGEPTWPIAEPLTVHELGATFPTYSGRLRVTVPVTVTSESARLGHELARESLDLTITVRFQSCDETTCQVPDQVDLVLTAPLERLVEPAGLQTYAERVEAVETERGARVR